MWQRRAVKFADIRDLHGPQHWASAIKAVSQYTYTMMLSSELSSPLYEGASRIYAEDEKEAGSGWVEQMVGDPAKKGANQMKGGHRSNVRQQIHD